MPEKEKRTVPAEVASPRNSELSVIKMTRSPSTKQHSHLFSEHFVGLRGTKAARNSRKQGVFHPFRVLISADAGKISGASNEEQMKSTHIAYTLAALMCGTSAASIALQPTRTATAKGSAVPLEAIVPKDFGEWNELPNRVAEVVNPQTKELLDKLYSQLLSRSYVNKDGYRIMLSLAYGDDQRGGLQAHRPEVCYPAQGFKLGKLEDGRLGTAYGDIEVRRLNTVMGERVEPVTYWLTVGSQVVQTGLDKRIAQIRLGLTGQIPDGLLFRVSSIDADSDRAFLMQQKFVADLMVAVPDAPRKQLSGLGAVKTGS
jgi:EpsI family protein